MASSKSESNKQSYFTHQCPIVSQSCLDKKKNNNLLCLPKPYCLSFSPFVLLLLITAAATLLTCSPPQSSLTLQDFFPPFSLSTFCSVSLFVLPFPCLLYHTDSRSMTPTSLQPRAPSPLSPDEFPLNVKQAYKAFAAVPRSLAVLEPPQVGRADWTRAGRNTSMLC